MTNKYLTKIASLIYPRIQHTEFDAAFKGDANPTRDSIEDWAHKTDVSEYERDYADWEEAHSDLMRNPESTKEDIHAHWEEEPDFENYRGNTLHHIFKEHSHLSALSGQEVPGPNKWAAGTGYAIGGGLLAAGLYNKNPLLGVAGAAGIGLGELIRRGTQPEKRLNSFNNRATSLEKRKDNILRQSRGE